MTKRDWVVGEFSFHGKHAINAPIIKLSAKGKKGIDVFCEIIFTWIEYGHLPINDFEDRFKEFKKVLEVRKNGYKGQIAR